MDMTQFTLAKGQQVNADDLISGPRTIKITRVVGNEGNKEQPVAVRFEGDDGKPFMPCKTMRRLMVAAWGPDASAYTGRSLTLYRDPTVRFGGMEIGGVRISHMSHIDSELKVALTSTRGKRGMVHVKPLVVEPATSKTTTSEPVIDREEMQRQADAAKGMSPEEKKEWWGKLTDAEKAVVRELTAKKDAGDE